MTKINWGVLGTAHIAKTAVIPAMVNARNCRLLAIAGRHLEKVEQFQKMFDIPKGYQSYDDLLNDPEIQAIYIPLSNDLHKEWTIKALRKKKHVLIEKPMAVNVEDIMEIFQVARDEGVLVMEAFAYLHSEITQSLAQTIVDKVIGEVNFMESAFFIPNLDENNFRMSKEKYGGVMYDLGCYNLSLFLRLLGEKPIKVEATANYTPTGIDDYSAAYLEFPSGARASSTCGLGVDPSASRYVIYGTKGKIQGDYVFNSKGNLSYTITRGEEVKTVTLDVTDNYQLEVEQFGRAIEGAEEIFVTNEFSYHVAGVMDRVLEKMGY